MSTPFLAQIDIFPFNFAPKGWALCNGQLLAINQNQALFSLLGTTYGGNGVQTFALPNLQGLCMIGYGTASSGSYVLGQTGGELTHTLVSSEIAPHTHPLVANSTAGGATTGAATGNFPAVVEVPAYTSSAPSPLVTLTSTATSSQPHANQQPYLVLNFCIALSGIFPSRN